MAVIHGFFGILVLTGIAFLLSSNRKKINWITVGGAIGLQILLAFLILKVPFIQGVFDWLAKGFVKLIGFTQFVTDFLFGSFLDSGKVDPSLVNFAFNVLPTIIFFSALTALLYYLRILQLVVFVFAWIMKVTLRLSGAESLAAAGNVFLGQTESPLLVKPYLNKMTKSEMACLMTGGMATIAGGVLASYITFLSGGDKTQELFIAKHLLAASIMSAPAAVAAAKLLVPETEDFDGQMKITKDRGGSNVLEALAIGTTDGLKLAVNVGAMLLVFTALMYLGNFILGDVIGHYTGLNDLIQANTSYDKLSFQMMLGYIGAPIAMAIGVCQEDALLVGQLLGEKTVLNEFYAYVSLGQMKGDGVFTEKKSWIMATYVLCGFANFASIGIQIGGIGALVPGRKKLLSELGFKALIGGTLACLYTAAVVGMYY
ncbi:MAG: Na+ dependent nucleoside transporter [Flavobacteriales bacterium]|nr:Na+ dependent nucleoside transporter [Flavobacteriales bacterium]